MQTMRRKKETDREMQNEHGEREKGESEKEWRRIENMCLAVIIRCSDT